jgi:hypothetical protein
MRAHDHDSDVEASLRPKADRIEAEEHGQVGPAAAAGRPDVLGASGLLGLQRAAGNAAVTGLVEEERSPVLDVVGSGGGQPLDTDTRADMEGRLGHDFGDVRVHTDSKASDSAKAVSAHAYTVGSNIVFQRDAYDPGSDTGKHMLAHELTHVVQQRSGPVDGTATGGGIAVSNPSDRFERDAVANADRVMADPAPAPAVQSASNGAHGTPVQRAEEAPDAPVQRAEEAPEEEEQTAQTFVQREGEDEEPAEDV